MYRIYYTTKGMSNQGGIDFFPHNLSFDLNQQQQKLNHATI